MKKKNKKIKDNKRDRSRSKSRSSERLRKEKDGKREKKDKKESKFDKYRNSDEREENSNIKPQHKSGPDIIDKSYFDKNEECRKKNEVKMIKDQLMEAQRLEEEARREDNTVIISS